MKRIQVKIVKGVTIVEAQGYKGESCKNATSALEKALGNVIEDVDTIEMFEEEIDEHMSESE